MGTRRRGIFPAGAEMGDKVPPRQWRGPERGIPDPDPEKYHTLRPHAVVTPSSSGAVVPSTGPRAVAKHSGVTLCAIAKTSFSGDAIVGLEVAPSKRSPAVFSAPRMPPPTLDLVAENPD
ncbi:hypothetical protein PIB30_016750, partial [Stylosanthes scabra]|nr:hypothetical protein [Stylosanthes scabra]